MNRVIVAAVAVLVVFAAGFAVGRSTAGGAGEVAAVDPDSLAQPLGSRDNPVPALVGHPIGAWELVVLDTFPDATELLLAANEFNSPPPEGMRAVLLDVELRRRPVGPGQVLGSIAPVLATPVSVHDLSGDCGVLARPVDVQQVVAEGEAVAGEWCWVVPEADLPKLLLEVRGIDGDQAYFSLG